MPEAQAPAAQNTLAPALRMRGLSYRYPGAAALALESVDLQLDPGEFVVLAGRSGSGKSTLLKTACGLVPHFHGGEISGEVEIGGSDLRESGPAELSGIVGYVAQDAESHVVSTTVRSEIELPLELRGEPDAARERAVEEVALALGIPELLRRTTDTLSGGELQRVALAAALVTRPKLILLDEPTSQLDPVAGDELIGLLRRLNEEWGTTIILGEHRLERCLSQADRVIALEGGSIAFDGPPGRLLAWAAQQSPELLTPGARMVAESGIWDPGVAPALPVGVKEARSWLRGQELDIEPAAERGIDLRRPSAAERSGDRLAEVRGLRFSMPRGAQLVDVLRGIDLDLRAGEKVALMGRNGAGKTTLLRALAGLIDPLGGRIRRPEHVVLLGQRAGDYLVHDTLARELPGEAGRAALSEAGLIELSDRDPRDISGGQRQRAALAVAMAGRDPRGAVICLDEPTRGLDRSDKSDLAEAAGGWAGAGAAVLICTHDVEFAAGFADRVVLMGEGQIVADGPAPEVLAGGWYFATEVARILGLDGVVSAADGARVLRAAGERS